MKKFLSWFTVLTMLLGLLPMEALAAGDTYNIKVGGTAVTSENAGNVLGDGAVSYDAESCTLTLNNARIDSADAAICCEEPSLTLVLKGNNTLTSSAAYTVDMQYSDLTVQGPGSLVVRNTSNTGSAISGATLDDAGGNVTLCEGADVTVEGYTGINITGALTIRGAAVDATGTGPYNGALIASKDITIQNSTVMANTSQTSAAGICSKFGSVVISNGSTVRNETSGCSIEGSRGVSVQNSLVTFRSTQSDSAGIFASSGSVTISDGSRIEGEANGSAITGTDGILLDSSHASITFTGSVGFYSPNGDIEIRNGSTVGGTTSWSLLNTTGDIRISGSTVIADVEADSGLYAQGDIEIIDGSTVEGKTYWATLNAEGNIRVSGSAVTAEALEDGGIWTNGDLTIENGSNVSSAGIYPGVGAWGVVAISDSTVNAVSDAGVGIRADNGLTISGENTVVKAESFAVSWEVTDPDADDYGALYCFPGISSYGDIVITGGTVTATAYDAAGMQAFGNVQISGENTEVIISNTDANDVGLDVTGDIAVSGGQVTVSSPAGQGIGVQGSLDITGGNLTVNSQGLGIYIAPNVDSGLNVSGGELNVVSQETDGILGGAMTVAGGTVSVECGTDKNPIHIINGLEWTGGVLKLPHSESDDVIKANAKQYYLVTFDGQNNKEATGVLVEKDTLAAQPKNPVRTGYTFDGWYTDSGCTTEWNFENDIVTRHMTLYAKWTGSGTSGTFPSGPSVGGDPSGGDEHADCPSKAFTDLDTGKWYHEAVDYALDNSLFYGTSGTTFSPGSAMTRGMLTAVLYRAAGSPDIEDEVLGYPFADVNATAYYGTAVYWARLNGIVSGYGDGRFGPNDPITREQLAAILWRQAGSPESSDKLDSFTDISKAGAYALPALRWAVEQGILSGKGNGVLDPKGNATRAEVASMLMRYYENVK